MHTKHLKPLRVSINQTKEHFTINGTVQIILDQVRFAISQGAEDGEGEGHQGCWLTGLAVLTG